jgi:hypothetical protein
VPYLNTATRAHLWRLIRITAFGLATAPEVVALFHTWVVRYPLLAGLPAVLEVIWRTISPTVQAPPVVARHAAATVPPQAPTPAPLTSEQTYTPVARPAEPAQPPGQRPDPAPPQ